MNQRSQILGYALLAFAVILTDPFTTVGFGQDNRDLSFGQTNHSVFVGRLIRSGRSRNGTPRFALLGDEGSVTAYIVPATGMNVGQHVNRQVGVTARSIRRGPNRIPYILAQQVSQLESVNPVETVLDEPRIIIEEADPLADVMQDFSDEDASTSIADLLWRDLDDEVVLAQAQENILPPMPNTVGPSPGYTSDFGVAPSSDYNDFYGHRGMGLPTGAPCGDPNCKTCGPPQPARWWARAEYLSWQTKGMNIPPLITQSTDGTPANQAGVLGLPSTSTILGNQDIVDSNRHGGRLTLGYWFDDYRKRAVEVEYFSLGRESDSYAVTSGGDPILARPFVNAITAENDSELVAFPGIVHGTVTAGATSELISFAPRYRANLKCRSGLPFGLFSASNCVGGCKCVPSGRRLDLTLGYRYMRLNESLSINERLTTLNTDTPSTFDLTDGFATKNEFNGAELGLVWEAYRGRWTIELLSRLALGNNRRSVSIDGETISSTQGVTFDDPGGLLALGSNMGRYSSNQFVAIPELGANVGFHISPKFRVLLGYSVLYWDKVARPGDQIDLNVNPNLLPPPLDPALGPSAPRFVLEDTNYWAQGFNLGLDFQW